MATIRIATRRSPLALWQAHFVQSELEKLHAGLSVELVPMVTKGDKIIDTPLAKIGGKGLFVKELEHALLENRADIAVHSMKDVPAEFPEGLELNVICERENPTDAFVSNQFKTLDDLPENATVGTASLRRQCQLAALRPDLHIKTLRGNVGTRLQKLDDGEFDAIILASAGLIRLDLADRINQEIAPEIMLPAAGQGAVGIECRSNDTATKEYLAPLNHALTASRVIAERAMSHKLQGGCQVPIGAFATVPSDSPGQLTLKGIVGEVNGSRILTSQRQYTIDQANELGVAVATDLIQQGAEEIINNLLSPAES